MSDPTPFEFTGPADSAAVDAAHELVDRLWGGDETLSDLDRLRFESALVEVVGNVIAHASNPPGKQVVTLRVTVSSDAEWIEGRLEDDGGRVDIDLSATPEMPNWMAESGRGLALAQALCDELTYRRQDGRNVWVVGCER